METDPRTFIPHRAPALCIDTIVAVDNTSAIADRLVEDSATVAGELWEPWLIEGLAQTAAILHGFYGRSQSHRNRQGLLVGIRRLRFTRRPRTGETIRFEVNLIKRVAPLTLLDAVAYANPTDDGEMDIVAKGEMKFFVEVDE